MEWNRLWYIIYEFKNGKGYIKELSDYGSILFEGEYLNGKRNGKGKEYNSNGILKYEGYYKDGKRNGKGKEYFSNEEILIFEGDYLYNSRIKGKEYFTNGKLDFEGEYLFNERWNGKLYDEDGNILDKIENGKRNVKINKSYKTKVFKNGKLIFEGYILNHIKHGQGKEYDFIERIIFEGEFSYGRRWNGKGEESNFKGEYLKGQRWNGKGRETVEYEGDPTTYDAKIEYKNGEKFIKSARIKKIEKKRKKI